TIPAATCATTAPAPKAPPVTAPIAVTAVPARTTLVRDGARSASRRTSDRLSSTGTTVAATWLARESWYERPPLRIPRLIAATQSLRASHVTRSANLR